MGFEHERKFIVVSEGWRRHVRRSNDLRQGYLAVTEQVEVRVRVTDEDAELTTKSREGEVRRTEVNVAIAADAANNLLDSFAKRIISKTRYELNLEPNRWTVDVFHDEDDGLVLLEVEGEDDLERVTVPTWAGREVTTDPRYRNSYLSEHPFRSRGDVGTEGNDVR